MDAVDTLTSHLQTTFTALSTAYALRQERRTLNNAGDESHALITETAYMAYVLGSSVGAAKARVMFALSGLEVKMWGARTESDELQGSVSDVDESDDDSSSSLDDGAEDEGSKTGSECEEQLNDSEDGSASPPPSSRSPSPSPVSRPASPLTSIMNTPPSTVPFRIATSPQTTSVVEKSPPKSTQSSSSRILSENTPPSALPRRRPLSVLGPSAQQPSPSRRVLSSRTDGENAPPRLRPGQSISAPLTRLPLSQKSTPRATPQPAQSYDEEQQVLRAADRLLSRTLAKACAEEDGGLSAELGMRYDFALAILRFNHSFLLAPTQTHVLVRAPRCFSHPAWVPRQNLTRTLESQLQIFLEDSIQHPSEDDRSTVPKKAQRLGVKTEGVWVTCANGETPKAPQTKEKDESVHEDDEMIWWVWNGKIVGFSDW